MMTKLVFFIALIGFNFCSFAQVQSLNSQEKQKERITHSNAKPLNQSKSKPTSRVKMNKKIHYVPRKENYELELKKD